VSFSVSSILYCVVSGNLLTGMADYSEKTLSLDVTQPSSRLCRVHSQARSIPAVSSPDAPIIFYDQNDAREDDVDCPRARVLTKTEDKSEKQDPRVSVVTDSDDAASRRPSSSSTQVDDPNIVDWCCEDPTHPQNWKARRKWTAIALGTVSPNFAAKYNAEQYLSVCVHISLPGSVIDLSSQS
jgi:hypothetical protein